MTHEPLVSQAVAPTRLLGVRGVSALPVIDERRRRLIGIITRDHILAAYQRALTGGRRAG